MPEGSDPQCWRCLVPKDSTKLMKALLLCKYINLCLNMLSYYTRTHTHMDARYLITKHLLIVI